MAHNSARRHAQWDISVADYGPSVVNFPVLANLAATNTVNFHRRRRRGSRHH